MDDSILEKGLRLPLRSLIFILILSPYAIYWGVDHVIRGICYAELFWQTIQESQLINIFQIFPNHPFFRRYVSYW